MMKKSRKRVVKKTSSEWYDEMNQNEELKTIILDPDGWDRQNYEYSFYEEEITHEEFKSRLLQSTTMKME